MKFALPVVCGAVLASVLSACGALPQVTIGALPPGGAQGSGIPFVIPRTVVKIEGGAGGKVTFTVAPVAYAEDGATTLPRFLASASGGGFSLSPTTVTAVDYADELIVKQIGTQVTDYRKDAIDAVAGIAAVAVTVRAPDDCANPGPLRPFVIDRVTVTPAARAPNNPCWAYSIQAARFAPVAMRAYPVAGLAAVGQVGWFPIAACRPWVVTVYQCADPACTPLPDSAITAVLSASDGTQYRRVPLPAKGSVALHPDFCQADVTNASVGSSGWDLLNQLTSDVKAARK